MVKKKLTRKLTIKSCSTCNGSGAVNKQECSDCNGKGVIKVYSIDDNIEYAILKTDKNKETR